MRFSTILLPVLAATSVAAQNGRGKGGKGVQASGANGRGNGGNAGNNGAAGNNGNGNGNANNGRNGGNANTGNTANNGGNINTGNPANNGTANANINNGATNNGTANANIGNNNNQANNGNNQVNNGNNQGQGNNGGNGATVQTSNTGTAVNQLGINGGEAGGALNAGSTAANGPNGLPQLANPQPQFDATTNQGQFGPFVPVSAALPAATGAPQTVDAQTAQALQAAADNWSFDTSQVSNFLNTGKSLTGQQFNQGANIAYNAEVDELTHKAILDQVIGNDPDVSIANQTLTNGVFQSVVNNLQVMADQGANTQQLINAIDSVRCTQILPSIDTYMAVAARTIGQGATLRTAIRPDTCQGIVQGAPDSAFPGNIQVLQVRGNAGQTTQNAPAPNPNQGSVNGQPVPASGPGSNLAGAGNNQNTPANNQGNNQQGNNQNTPANNQGNNQQGNNQQGNNQNTPANNQGNNQQNNNQGNNQQGNNQQNNGAANNQNGGAANNQNGGAANNQNGGASNSQNGANGANGANKGAGAASAKGKKNGRNKVRRTEMAFKA